MSKVVEPTFHRAVDAVDGTFDRFTRLTRSEFANAVDHFALALSSWKEKSPYVGSQSFFRETCGQRSVPVREPVPFARRGHGLSVCPKGVSRCFLAWDPGRHFHPSVQTPSKAHERGRLRPLNPRVDSNTQTNCIAHKSAVSVSPANRRNAGYTLCNRTILGLTKRYFWNCNETKRIFRARKRFKEGVFSTIGLAPKMSSASPFVIQIQTENRWLNLHTQNPACFELQLP